MDPLIGCPQAEQELPTGPLPRHRHRAPYATLVLQGSYIERGLSGRWTVEAGHIVAHGLFDCHDNIILRARTKVLNIPLPPTLSLPPVFTVRDPDALITAIRRGNANLPLLLHPEHRVPASQENWPDLLANHLRQEAGGITEWARGAGLAPATVSRGFAAAYGVTPAAYRMEAQVMRAFRQLLIGNDPLAGIAADCGFADQAHLCRSIKSLSGYPPSHWRRVKSVQDRETTAA